MGRNNQLIKYREGCRNDMFQSNFNDGLLPHDLSRRPTQQRPISLRTADSSPIRNRVASMQICTNSSRRAVNRKQKGHKLAIRTIFPIPRARRPNGVVVPWRMKESNFPITNPRFLSILWHQLCCARLCGVFVSAARSAQISR